MYVEIVNNVFIYHLEKEKNINKCWQQNTGVNRTVTIAREASKYRTK